jgi:hypothetical protein
VTRPTSLRVTVVLAVVAIGALVLGTLDTPASSQTVRSDVTIAYNASTDSFSGTVRAGGNCRAQRAVTVFERRSKPAKTSRKKRKTRSRQTTIGHASTSPSGSWGPVPNTGGSGRFYAKVSASAPSGYGDATVCGAAKSKTIRVP